MVRVARNITMLLTLLLVIICNMGAICVCQCHGELFMGSCSCLHHEQANGCGCHRCASHADHHTHGGHAKTTAHTTPHTPAGGTQAAIPAHHECKHLLLTTDELLVPGFNTAVPEAPAHWVTIADFLPAVGLGTCAAAHIPPAPDIPPNARHRHEGFLLPLLI